MSIHYDFSPDEIQNLIDFLQKSSGRIAAAVVPGSGAADKIIETLKRRSKLLIEIPHPVPSVGELGPLSRKLRDRDTVLVLMLDGRAGSPIAGDLSQYLARLNFHRENLSAGKLRTLVVLDPLGAKTLAAMADDIHDVWMRFDLLYDPNVVDDPTLTGQNFTSIPAPSKNDFAGGTLTLIIKRDELMSAGGTRPLERLKSQLVKARETGIAEGNLVQNFALPLFEAFLFHGLVRDARRVFDQDLREGKLDEILNTDEFWRLARSSILLAKLEGTIAEYDQATSNYLQSVKLHLAQSASTDYTLIQLSTAHRQRGDFFLFRGRVDAASREYDRAKVIAEEQLLGGGNRNNWELDLARTLDRLGEAHAASGNWDNALRQLADSLRIRQRLLHLNERAVDILRDIVGTEIQIADLYLKRGELLQAQERYLEVARGIDGAKLMAGEEFAFDACVVLVKTATLNARLTNIERSAELFERALEEAERHSRASPSNVRWQWLRAVTMHKLGDLEYERGATDAASERFSASSELLERLLSQSGTNIEWQSALCTVRMRKGDALRRIQQLDAAQREYSSSLRLAQEIDSRAAENPFARRLLIAAHVRLGDLSRIRRNLDSAQEEYEKALILAKELLTQNPHSAEGRSEITLAFNRLGSVYLKRQRFDEAEKVYLAAFQFRAEAHAANPADEKAGRELAISYRKLGDIKIQRSEPSDAVKLYGEARELVRAIRRHRPRENRLIQEEAVLASKIGVCHIFEKRFADALVTFQSARILLEQLVASSPENVDWLMDLRACIHSIHHVHLKEGRAEAAAEAMLEEIGLLSSLEKSGRATSEQLKLLLVAKREFVDLVVTQSVDKYRGAAQRTQRELKT